MSANRTTWIVVGIVAALMACTIAGVYVASNNQISTDSDTATYTPVVTVADSNYVSSDNGTVKIKDVTQIQHMKDRYVYSSWAATTSPDGTAIKTADSTITVTNGTITIDQNLKRTSTTSSPIIFLSTPTEVSYNNASKTLSIGTTVATAYLKNCDDSYLTVFTSARLLDTSSDSTGTYTMATLKDLVSKTSVTNNGVATMTLKLIDVTDSSNNSWAKGRTLDVTTNYTNAVTFSLGWYAYYNVADGTYANNGNSVNFEIRNDTVADYGSGTTITMARPATDFKYTATVNATNYLDSRASTSYMAVLDLTDLARHYKVTFSMGYADDSLNNNVLATALPAANGDITGTGLTTLLYPANAYTQGSTNSLTIVFKNTYAPTEETVSDAVAEDLSLDAFVKDVSILDAAAMKMAP